MTIDSEAQRFVTVFRGFDPSQVEATLTSVRAAAAAATADRARIEERLSAVETERNELRRRYADAEARLEAAQAQQAQQMAQANETAEPAQGSFMHLGKRIGTMLSLAETEAETMRSEAIAEAASIRESANADADAVRQRAEQLAAEARERAETEAEQTDFEAKEKAAAIIDEALRDAAARREEAEAYFERQRAKASAAAADFERTLSERRDLATQDFQVQMASNEEELRRVKERAATLAAESERERQLAAEESAQRLQAARQEAAELLESARAHAERVRHETERELSAAMARRDSITSQLSNVRNMLATFGITTVGGQVDPAAIAQLAAQESNGGEARWSTEDIDMPQAEQADGQPEHEAHQEHRTDEVVPAG